ncbi:hypothetical protein HOG27_00720 [bacterium]|nr:hypothetical protein [bacterium]
MINSGEVVSKLAEVSFISSSTVLGYCISSLFCSTDIFYFYILDNSNSIS